jgi:hypothetical protein
LTIVAVLEPAAHDQVAGVCQRVGGHLVDEEELAGILSKSLFFFTHFRCSFKESLCG